MKNDLQNIELHLSKEKLLRLYIILDNKKCEKDNDSNDNTRNELFKKFAKEDKELLEDVINQIVRQFKKD